MISELQRWTRLGLIVLCATLASLATVVASCATAPEAEAVSFLGDELRPMPLTIEERTRLLADLEAARAELEANPTDEMALIWYGRRLAYLGRYQEAVATYTRGLELYPESSKLLRHRGHRYITLRKLELAIEDLSQAAEIAREEPNTVEADGIPNAKGIPRSTNHFNIWYHLGLARYLSADFQGAYDAYRQCLRVGRNDDSLCATLHWMIMTLRRMDRHEDAERYLTLVRREMDVIENESYHRLLLFYDGRVDAESLLAEVEEGSLDMATVAYGLGTWLATEGDGAGAEDLYQLTVRGGFWPAFGHIAAEAELARPSR